MARSPHVGRHHARQRISNKRISTLADTVRGQEPQTTHEAVSGLLQPPALDRKHVVPHDADVAAACCRQGGQQEPIALHVYLGADLLRHNESGHGCECLRGPEHQLCTLIGEVANSSRCVSYYSTERVKIYR
jgi:hypothetical protein